MQIELAAKFELGPVMLTAGACGIDEDEINTALSRYRAGDWGDLEEEDATMNDKAVTDGGRIMASYHTKDDVKFWVITEWDRSVTTILLPLEY